MRERTQHIDNQPLTHNSLVMNKLQNVDNFDKNVGLPFAFLGINICKG